MSLDQAKCRGCDAGIVWALTPRGKKMPLDAEPVRRVVMLPYRPGSSDLRATVAETYMPHHATCPNVADFRELPLGQERDVKAVRPA